MKTAVSIGVAVTWFACLASLGTNVSTGPGGSPLAPKKQRANHDVWFVLPGRSSSTDGIGYQLPPEDPSEQLYPRVYVPPIDRTDLNACVLAAPTICLKRMYESILDTPDDIASICQVCLELLIYGLHPGCCPRLVSVEAD
jgi:hypothetical protein